MKIKVAKFGGSSLADAACFRRVRARILEDGARRIVVVSAPGARTRFDEKMTDLLERGDLRTAQRRFDEIAGPLGLRPPVLPKREDDREERLSLGERCCAQLLAQYLGWKFIDARALVVLNERRECLLPETLGRLRNALNGAERIVLPGFYGSTPDGRLLTLPRGGSDITGALAAVAADASVYENFTDVDGVYTRDPARFPDAQPLPRLTYEQLRRLARDGARVMHEDAIAPVETARIPMHILSTFEPNLPGTWITKSCGYVASDVSASPM